MSIQNVITLVGIPAIMAALVYIGRKLRVLDTLEKTMEKMYELGFSLTDLDKPKTI